MVTNHDDAVVDHHPTTTRGFTETVNWALKHASFSLQWLEMLKAAWQTRSRTKAARQNKLLVYDLGTRV